MSREQDRWPRAKQVLDDVIAAEAGEQSSFLDRACDGEERSQLKEASTSYNAGAETWRQIPSCHPRLTPWAALLRRSAAIEIRGIIHLL